MMNHPISILFATWACLATPLLVLAGFTNHEMFRAGYRMGAYNYIDKMSWCTYLAKNTKEDCEDAMHKDVENIIKLRLVP